MGINKLISNFITSSMHNQLYEIQYFTTISNGIRFLFKPQLIFWVIITLKKYLKEYYLIKKKSDVSPSLDTPH